MIKEYCNLIEQEEQHTQPKVVVSDGTSSLDDHLHANI